MGNYLLDSNNLSSCWDCVRDYRGGKMRLSNEISSFAAQIDKQPLDFSLGEIIKELENFAIYVEELEDNLKEVEDELSEYKRGDYCND